MKQGNVSPPRPLSSVGSPPTGGVKGKVRVAPALQGGTDETTIGYRLSLSARGSRAVLTVSVTLGLGQMEMVLMEGETGQAV